MAGTCLPPQSQDQNGSKGWVPVVPFHGAPAVGCVCRAGLNMLGECPATGLHPCPKSVLKRFYSTTSQCEMAEGHTWHMDFWQIVMVHRTQKTKVLPAWWYTPLIQRLGERGRWSFVNSRPLWSYGKSQSQTKLTRNKQRS